MDIQDFMPTDEELRNSLPKLRLCMPADWEYGDSDDEEVIRIIKGLIETAVRRGLGQREISPQTPSDSE